MYAGSKQPRWACRAAEAGVRSKPMVAGWRRTSESARLALRAGAGGC